MSRKIPVVTVDSNVPIPEDTKTKYPWATMGVGDSFLCPFSKRSSVAGAAVRYGQRTGKKFTIKKMGEDIVRVWRVE